MEAAGRSFAELLRELRRRAALSQEELAQRSGLTVKAIGALERGERTRPYPHTVRALADALQPDPAARAALIAAAPSRRATTPVETERPPHDPGQSADRDQPSGAIGDRPARTGEPGFLRPLTGPPIGREVELTELTALLGAGRNRLVTLVGPGGVGKTTLAIELAARLAEAYPGGPVVVELAALTAADLVLPAIARAFGVPETGDPEAATAVIARLGDRRALLVLDNLEHLLSAAPAIAEILPVARIWWYSPPAGHRCGCAARRSWRSSHCRCRSPTISRRSLRPLPSRSSSGGPSWSAGPPRSGSIRRWWPRSAVGWRVCRWRWSWRPRRPGCCRRAS
jgi:transcriptional regulator with XRE-family HTH domain